MAAIALLSFASCNKEVPAANDGNQINFTADIQAMAVSGSEGTLTKAASSDSDLLTISVTASAFPDAEPATKKIVLELYAKDITTFSVACHNGTGYEFTDGVYNLKSQNWVGTKHYFHGDPTKTLTFYAFTALQGNGSVAAPAMNTTGTSPKVTYTVPADSLKQLDLICAKAVASDRTSENVALSFRHMLTGVRFEDKVSELGYIIQYIKIGGVYTTGTFDLSTVVTTGGELYWTNLANKAEFYVAPRTVDGKRTFSTPEGQMDFLMLPQEAAGSYIEVGFNTKEGGLLRIARLDLSSFGWPAANIYTYSIKLNQ